MHIDTFFEVISAAHVSYKLTGIPSEFSQRAGIMLVAPPGHLKTEIINGSLTDFHNALILSDLNTRSLHTMRDDIVGGKLQTIAFPDFEKIYERDPATSSNLEGHLKAMVAQGFTIQSVADQRMNGVRKARALMVGGMIPKIYQNRFTRWYDEGMTRRFLWAHYQLKNPDAILDAISNWEPVRFDALLTPLPASSIPFEITSDEDRHIQKMLSQHEGGISALQFILMKKVGAVLKWKHRRSRGNPSLKMLSTMADFSEALTKTGADVDL